MPVTSAASNTAVPEAVSQPKKQLPNFIPPKTSFCRPTTSRRSGTAVVSFAVVAAGVSLSVVAAGVWFAVVAGGVAAVVAGGAPAAVVAGGEASAG
jgi:hypothetical protein